MMNTVRIPHLEQGQLVELARRVQRLQKHELFATLDARSRMGLEDLAKEARALSPLWACRLRNPEHSDSRQDLSSAGLRASGCLPDPQRSAPGLGCSHE